MSHWAFWALTKLVYSNIIRFLMKISRPRPNIAKVSYMPELKYSIKIFMVWRTSSFAYCWHDRRSMGWLTFSSLQPPGSYPPLTITWVQRAFATSHKPQRRVSVTRNRSICKIKKSEDDRKRTNLQVTQKMKLLKSGKRSDACLRSFTWVTSFNLGHLTHDSIPVTGCLRPTPTDNLPILADIQPPELCRSGATTLSPERRAMEPGHLLHSALTRPSGAAAQRLKSRHLFVSAAQQLISFSDNNNIRAVQWADHQWNAEWVDNPTRLRILIPDTGTQPSGITFPRRAWIQLNCLRTSVGRFCSCLYKWGMASSAACECGAEEQTTNQFVFQCPIHRPLHGLHARTVLDDETTEWLLNTCPEI